MKELAVVILNYNGKKWLEKFLPNVLTSTSSELSEVIVVDNGSTDESVSFMKTQFPAVRLIELGVNTGYAGGYLKTLDTLHHPFFCLLNSDVEVTPYWDEAVLTFMKSTPDCGACQPKILSYHQKNSFEYAGAAGGYLDYFAYPYCRGRIFDALEEDHGQYNTTVACDWASGACLFVRAEAYKNAGKLDASFFAHMEEIDLCWRIRNLGYQVYALGNVSVYHVGGGTLPQGNPWKTELNFRNNLCMIYKNMHGLERFLVIFCRLFLDGIAGIYSLLKGKPGDVLAILKAHFAFYAMIPKLQKTKTGKRTLSRSPQFLIAQYFISGKRKFSELSGLSMR